MTVFKILVLLYYKLHSTVHFSYARLYSMIFFNIHIKLIGRAKTKIHPSTYLDMQNSKIIVENGTLEIGYIEGWGVKAIRDSCVIRLDNSTLHIIGDVSLRPGVGIWAMGGTIVIRNGTFINGQTEIIAGHRVEIGEHCLIARNVMIMDNDLHKHAVGDEKPVEVFKAVLIGNHCWIGANAMILKGVKIGDGAIVSAGSIVTKDVKERTLVAGVPANVIQENVVWEA